MITDDALYQVHKCLSLKEAGESRAEIARLLHIPASLVKTRLAQVKHCLINHLLPVINLLGAYPLEDLEGLREEVKDTQLASDINLETSRQDRSLIRTENVVELLTEKFKTIVPPIVKVVHAFSSQPTETILYGMYSDAHIGKHTSSFEPCKAKQAMDTMTEFLVNKANEVKPQVITMALLGDLLDGYGIFKTQVSEVSLTGTEQFIYGLETIASNIHTLLRHSPSDLEIIGIAGNHGRISTPEVATWENFERLLYSTLEVWFRNEPRVTFILPPKDGFHICHRKVFAFHGHEISGGGTLDNIVNRVRQWQSLYDYQWKVSMCGHFHRFMIGSYPRGKYHFTNGTASLTDAFIERLGAGHSNTWHSFLVDLDANLLESYPVKLY